MRTHTRSWVVIASLALALSFPRLALSFSIDRDGDTSLGLRAYTAVRIATENFDEFTAPRSSKGNLRQHRYFLEIEFKHKLMKLVRNSSGPLALFRHLRLPIDDLRYTIAYRGEGEGLYDYGPAAYTTFDQYKTFVPDVPDSILPTRAEVREYGRELQRRTRRIGRQRHRLFLAFVDLAGGPFFFRIGRQNLSWGETDVFRLLDNINPLDNGFGGVFIPLDERRMPLDMLRMNVALPDWGPFSQAFFEGFGAFGNRVAFQPGIPDGSPWAPAAATYPNTQIRNVRKVPDLEDLRGGGRLVFNAKDITFSVAHYWTYLDVPSVKLWVPPGVPTLDSRVRAIQTAPRVPITGASMSFAVPRYYAVVRSEFAYFNGEPATCQGIGNTDQAIQDPNDPDPRVQRGLRRLQRNLDDGCVDPWRYPGFLISTTPLVSHRAHRDSVNFALGLDINRYVRWLNPHQSFFITTQVFVKHIIDAFPDQVLPVAVRNFPLDLERSPLTPSMDLRNLEISFAKVLETQVLQTLRVQTSYRGGTVEPSMNVFYDWQGTWLYQPGIRFVRDPFRLILEYTGVSGVLGGQIGLLRDRDNVRIQLEAVF